MAQYSWRIGKVLLVPKRSGRFNLYNRYESTQMSTLRVAIVGAGFSGTMVAIHLLRQSEAVEIDLIDPRVPGRGLAYSTTCDAHLLNVPAVRMSAFGSEPLHFLNWLQSHGMPTADPGMFAPRKLYGTYIQDLFEETLRSAPPKSTLRHHFTKAVRLKFDGLSVTLFLENGERLSSDRVVLASGNPPSRSIADPLPGYFSSPWQSAATADLDPTKSVLLVGAGLTAVDAFLALVSQGHTGTVHILSRRGKLPQAHAPYRPLPNSFRVPESPTARGLLREIRAEVKEAATRGVDWRAVIDSIRPVTNEIWSKLPEIERRRVFRHGKTWWDIHRHRMAPEIGSKVQDAIARRQLIVHAGRLKQVAQSSSGLCLEIALRSGERLPLAVDRVINCTGPDNDYRSSGDRFLRSLVDAGYATAGRIGKGLRTSEGGDLIGADGEANDWSLTLGPPRLGDLLETIAVPELRKQAESVANRILSISQEPIEVMPELFIAAGI
jgi:uncharacterized NAD(P)/FAD-binding protein YdhS